VLASIVQDYIDDQIHSVLVVSYRQAQQRQKATDEALSQLLSDMLERQVHDLATTCLITTRVKSQLEQK